MAGHGGVLSRWGRKGRDGGAIPGEGIEPITGEEARALLEEVEGDAESFFEMVEG